jgi:hypothetical protein
MYDTLQSTLTSASGENAGVVFVKVTVPDWFAVSSRIPLLSQFPQAFVNCEASIHCANAIPVSYYALSVSGCSVTLGFISCS